MDILIKLYGTLIKSVENKDKVVEIKFPKNEDDAISLKGFSRLTINPADSVCVDIVCILNSLNIPEKSVALITINGKKSKSISPVKDKDKIKLYPFVAGG